MLIVVLNIAGVLYIIEHIPLNAIIEENYTIKGNNAEITIPYDYNFDENSKLFTKDNVSIMYYRFDDDFETFLKVYNTISLYGNESGYDNVTNYSIDNFIVYDYAVKTDDLKVIELNNSSNNIKVFIANLTDFNGDKIKSDHYRKIIYVNTEDNSTNELVVIAKSEEDDLYSAEIDDIIHSINYV